jgi:hypothetical protein
VGCPPLMPNPEKAGGWQLVAVYSKKTVTILRAAQYELPP